MLKSYLIVGFRNITRNLVPASVNIIGLSIALACTVSIFIILDSYYNLDGIHKKGDRLYLLMNKVKTGDNTSNWASSPYLFGPSLQEEQPIIESSVRIQRHGGISVRYNDLVFNEVVWFTDEDFFNVFSFPVLAGDVNSLRQKSSIVISKEMAEKYFGQEDPLGKELSLKFWGDRIKVFQVGAIMDPRRDQSSMFISCLIPIAVWEDLEAGEPIQWETWASSTFILMREGHHPAELEQSVSRFQKIQNEANETFKVEAVEFIPINKVSERSFEISNSLSWSNIPAAMIGFGVVAIMLILLACFNYVNVAVASVSTRIKEIGIRKVIGGGRKEIIQQFLIENAVLCTLALLVGTSLSYFFLIPGFNSLYPIDVPFAFSSKLTMIVFFIGTLLAVALISGAYPSLYVSSFSPVKILRGKEKFGSKSTLSKILLSFQFILSFTTIVGGLVFVRSSNYFEEKDWGYDHTQNFFVPLQNKEQFSALRDLVAQNKNIKSYAGSEGHVGYQNLVTTITHQDKKLNTVAFAVGFNYMETAGLRLKSGRSFHQGIQSDHQESVIVNESLVRSLGLSSPLNEVIEFNGTRYYIIGVVEDFYLRDFYSNVEPSFFHIAPEEDFRYLTVTAEAGTANEVAGFLRTSWKKIAPDDPYKGKAQDDVFANFYQANRSNNKILYFVCLVALVLASMGLYGLVSYNLNRRLKEFSIRKIFGANLLHIFNLMNRDYLGIVILSFVIGAPLGYYLIGKMLEAAYPEHIPVGISPFLITISMMIATVAITILLQLKRVSTENPTETLRSE
jgi:ABC-type antimicrobial peptide transport system permease subunit